MTNAEAIKYLIRPISTSTVDGEEKSKEFEAYKMAIEALEQQKTGHWIWNDGVWKFMCSVCKESVNPMPTCLGKPLMKYCPNCGCRMMEVE